MSKLWRLLCMAADLVKDFVKWFALNLGVKHLVITTTFVFVVSGSLFASAWYFYVRHVADAAKVEATAGKSAPSQAANHSDCSNTQISAGGSVDNSCKTDPPDSKK